MPHEYPGEITYMADDKFTPISKANIDSYRVFAELDGFRYMLDAAGITGFVFDEVDLMHTDRSRIRPALRVSLRDGVKGLKQAHFLRIREAYARKNLAATWYELYSKLWNGLVSDAEHLQGGKALWLSLIKTGRVTACDATTPDVETPAKVEDQDILWSTEEGTPAARTVLIYRA